MIDLTSICVTKGKAEKVRLAVNCWKQQTLPSNLLIVHQGLQWTPPEHPQITLVQCDPRLTLGRLRNEGLDRLQTPYWAQWDDDDLHRPKRLETQRAALEASPQAKGCMLSRWTMYDQILDKAWISWHRSWEGTLVARTSELRYPDLRSGEDTQFVGELGPQVVTLDEPDLYVYRCHGSNTYGRSHFMGLFRRSESVQRPGLGSEFSELESADAGF